jgi:hypothetical protein
MGAARAVHLIFLVTRVCRKNLKVDATKGLKTSSQVITIEKQLCMKECKKT